MASVWAIVICPYVEAFGQCRVLGFEHVDAIFCGLAKNAFIINVAIIFPVAIITPNIIILDNM